MSLKDEAKQALADIFAAIGHTVAKVPLTLRKPTAGKVYELKVLAHVLEDLAGRGFDLSFSNPDDKLVLKGGPCALDQNDPHFDVTVPGNSAVDFQVFVSVEFESMGAGSATKSDLSCVHELDIGVFRANAASHPSHEDIALAVECKAVATLTKAMVRSVLGLRRELSLLDMRERSMLAAAIGDLSPTVPANPPSEVWLVARDMRVTSYAASPAHFGVLCKHLA